MAELEKPNKKVKTKIKSWYSNRYQIVVVQRNLLLLLALLSMLSVAIAVIFVKNIMSSKSLEPYVIQVESKSGIATIVNQMTTQNFTGDQAIRNYFINQFVHAASGYDPKTYKQDAERVRLLSTSGIYVDYRNRINPRLLGSKGKIEVRIKSIQYINNNTAQIRVATQLDSPELGVQNKDQVITMGFYFTDLKLTMEERLINPLGFQVAQYLIADEVFSY